MVDVIDQFHTSSSLVKAAQDYRGGINVSVFGVQPFAKHVLVGAGGSGLVICPDVADAGGMVAGLTGLGYRAISLPPKEDALLYAPEKAGENIRARLKAFALALSGRVDFVVASAQSLLEWYPDREEFASRILTVSLQDTVDPYDLVRRLTQSGYKRQSQLTDVGEFALRGDILDVWPIAEDNAVRIEFFGDTVERIRRFDPDTQLSQEDAQEVFLSPAAEIFSFPTDLADVLKRAFPSSLSPNERSRAEDIVSDLIVSVDGGSIRYSQNWLLPFCKKSNMYSFFAPKRVVYDDCKHCIDVVRTLRKEHDVRFAEWLDKGEVTTKHKDALCEVDDLRLPEGTTGLAFQPITTANWFFSPQATHRVECSPLPAYHRDFKILEGDLRSFLSKGYRITFLLRDKTSAVVSDFCKDLGLSSSVTMLVSACEKGCAFPRDKQVFIGNGDVSLRAGRKALSRAKRDVFTAPEIGEYVVHEVHGIGMCEGVQKMNVLGANRDYLVLSYAGGDKLYVPIENMDSLSRYVASGAPPRLNKMGGAEFKALKERARVSVKKLAVDLVSLYKERQQNKGHRYSPDDGLLREFESRFPFVETDDQLAAVAECLKDLKSGKIMERLLCGDVGYGKTEVALRIAFKVICEGKQVAFLAPTTILAKQHFETVRKRMEEFGVNCVRLTRFDSAKSVARSVAELESGIADIAVGTHKMLSKSVKFKDLGLLILDEEQRFGVSDKEKLKDLKRNVNVLTLSATPIPRTLHMSMVGIRDISVLDSPPLNRIPVQTFVLEYGDTLLKDAVSREVGRGGQVFVVYNRVSSIDTFADKLRQMMPSVKICVGHGQMDEKTLEKRIDDFVQGKYDVLVASTIIENGIDMPRANTLFVVEADKLGLSQLYQLKGRVGRSDRAAYAYFTYDERKQMTENAYKRLEALASYTEFGSGFKIAMRDMEIRGAGNILGAEQHGHMEKVGYDTYCTLLKEAICEMEGKPVAVKREVRMNVDYDAYLPESFVSGGEWRLRLYSRIAEVADPAARAKLLGEIKDVYGQVPDPVVNLVNVAMIKNLAAAIGASAVTVKKTERKIVFDRVVDLTNAVNEVATAYEGRLDLSEKPSLKFRSNEALVKFLLHCRKIMTN